MLCVYVLCVYCLCMCIFFLCVISIHSKLQSNKPYYISCLHRIITCFGTIASTMYNNINCLTWWRHLLFSIGLTNGTVNSKTAFPSENDSSVIIQTVQKGSQVTRGHNIPTMRKLPPHHWGFCKVAAMAYFLSLFHTEHAAYIYIEIFF